ncbi:hypothetical protein GGX14DRAFT_394051 [Mycena pura]|uniref:Uncharacterized protein n=1 Tax=Mycena pura TaxID=153505 RepID=A0AAD6YG69_9AGAR|nr:hypothetical protein GGX14DRAFT_394051 [Mycena pura]
MPMLKHAPRDKSSSTPDAVQVYSTPPTGTQLAASCSRHVCQPSVSQFPAVGANGPSPSPAYMAASWVDGLGNSCPAGWVPNMLHIANAISAIDCAHTQRTAPEGPAVPAPEEPAGARFQRTAAPARRNRCARVRDAALSTAAAYCRPRSAAAACDCRAVRVDKKRQADSTAGRQCKTKDLQRREGLYKSKFDGGLRFDSLEATSDHGRAFGGLQGQVEDSDVVGIELAGFRDTSYGSCGLRGSREAMRDTPSREEGGCRDARQADGQTGRWAVLRRAGRQASVEATSGKTRYSGQVRRYSGGQAGAVGGWANGQDGKGNGQGNGQASVADRQVRHTGLRTWLYEGVPGPCYREGTGNDVEGGKERYTWCDGPRTYQHSRARLPPFRLRGIYNYSK